MKVRLSGQQWPLVQIIGIWKMGEFIMNSTWFPIFWWGWNWSQSSFPTVMQYRCDALRLQLHPDLWSSYGFGRSTLGTETLRTLQHLGYDVPCYRCFFFFRRCIWQSLWNEWIINQWIVEWNFEDYSTSTVRRHSFYSKFLISSFEHRRTEGQHSDLG